MVCRIFPCGILPSTHAVDCCAAAERAGAIETGEKRMRRELWVWVGDLGG